MLVVDPWHGLHRDGTFLTADARLYRRMLRIARFIEYGGPLKQGETRKTLLDCNRRARGKRCLSCRPQLARN